MEKTEYIVADPSGNITVLVLSPVDEKLRGETARRLMEEVDGAEQVGYLLSPKDEKAVIRLEMAGGVQEEREWSVRGNRRIQTFCERHDR